MILQFQKAANGRSASFVTKAPVMTRVNRRRNKEEEDQTAKEAARKSRRSSMRTFPLSMCSERANSDDLFMVYKYC